MNKQNQRQEDLQQNSEQGFPIQLKLLIAGIVIGLTILVLEFIGFFK